MKDLKTQMNLAFPAQTASDDLARRIDVLRARQEKKPQIYWRSAVGLAAVGGVAFCLILMPKIAGARALGAIDSALSNVSSFRIVEQSVSSDSTRSDGGVTFYLSGKSKRVTAGYVRYMSGDSETVYYPARNQAIRFPVTARRTELSDLTSMLSVLKRSTWTQGLSVKQVQDHGRAAVLVQANTKTEPIRVQVYADAKSQLPYHVQLFHTTADGGSRLQRDIVIDYSAPVSPSDVEPAFPQGTKVYDRDQLRGLWAAKLSKPSASVVQGKVTIAVRDVSVTNTGNVYVLYSSGIKHIPWKEQTQGHFGGGYQLTSISTPDGRTYLPLGGFQGTMYRTDDTFVSGFMIGGEDVQVAAFAPLNDYQVSGPVKLNLTFSEGHKSVSQQVTVPSATSPLVAEYFDFLGIAPTDEHNMLSQVSRARGDWYLAKQMFDEAEQCYREAVAQSDQYAASVGQTVLQGDLLHSLGLALKAQGKTTAARAILQEALEQTNPSSRFETDLIRGDLRSLTSTP